MSFAGFLDRDFDAYAPPKRKSNMFNRERLEVKQKLLALAKEVSGALVAADGSPLTIEASVEHPALWNHKQVEAQHVFFSRNEAARKELDGIIDRGKTMASLIDDPTPQRNHVFLAVSLDHERAEIAMKLHPDALVDRQNLERKLADHFAREKLVDLVGRLPAPFTVGKSPAPAIAEALLLETVAELVRPAATPWTVACAFPRSEVIAAGASFLAIAQETLASLVPIYQFVAWARENDSVQVREVLQKEKQSRRQKGLEKKDEVRFVRGVFVGKVGVVQDIDAKGGVKVIVGKVSVKVAAEDVVKS